MKRLEIKISDEEALILEQYCQQSEKIKAGVEHAPTSCAFPPAKTDVIRSYIRQLKRKVKKGNNC